MNTKILTFFTFFFLLNINFVTAMPVISLDLEISKENKVELLKMKIIDGRQFIPPLLEGDYNLKILDGFGRTLLEYKFAPVFIKYEDVAKEVEKIPLSIRYPFSQDMKKIVIYYKDEKIFEKEIFSCNLNGVCEEFENYVACPLDCKSGSRDGYCDKVKDGRCDPDCSMLVDEDCKIPVSLILVLLIVGLLSISSFLIRRKIKKIFPFLYKRQ